MWRRDIKRGQLDPFEECLKLIWLEMVREDLVPVVGHDHDYCVVAQTDHNYCKRSPWDHDYCEGALASNNNANGVPWDHDYAVK